MTDEAGGAQTPFTPHISHFTLPLAVDGFRMEVYAYTYSLDIRDLRPVQLFALPLPANSRGPEPRVISSWVRLTPTPYWTPATIVPATPATSTPTAATPAPPPPPGGAAPVATPTATSAVTPSPTPAPSATATATPTATPPAPPATPTPLTALLPRVDAAPSATLAPASTATPRPFHRDTPTWAIALLGGLGAALVAALAAILAGVWIWWRRRR